MSTISNKEHADVLRDVVEQWLHADAPRTALEAAIALLDPAPVHGDEAERGHCVAAVNAWLRKAKHTDGETTVSLLMRERAAARAEGELKGFFERVALEGDCNALKAENERLRDWSCGESATHARTKLRLYETRKSLKRLQAAVRNTHWHSAGVIEKRCPLCTELRSPPVETEPNDL